MLCLPRVLQTGNSQFIKFLTFSLWLGCNECWQSVTLHRNAGRVLRKNKRQTVIICQVS